MWEVGGCGINNSLNLDNSLLPPRVVVWLVVGVILEHLTYYTLIVF